MVLLTNPVNVAASPGTVGVSGQLVATAIAGALDTGQVTDAVSDADVPAQLSAAVAVYQ